MGTMLCHEHLCKGAKSAEPAGRLHTGAVEVIHGHQQQGELGLHPFAGFVKVSLIPAGLHEQHRWQARRAA